MHHDAAEGVRPEAPGFVAATVDVLREANRLRLLSLLGEFRRVMEHQDQAIMVRHAVLGGLQVACR